MRKLLLFIVAIGVAADASAQLARTLTADFSIKETAPNSENSLSTGQVFFDKLQDKLIYHINFPRQENILIENGHIYLFKADSLFSKMAAPSYSPFNMFKLSLEGNLLNYGLDNGYYIATESQEADSIVVTTWSPKSNIASDYGDILIAHHKKRLHGVVFMSPKKELIGKILFSKYSIISGISFPGEMVQVSIHQGKEYYKITTFSNVKIDSNESADWHKLRPSK